MAGAASSASHESADPGYSTTNNQEIGVDEPDLAKTDGHLLVALRHQPLRLQVVDVSSAGPHLAGVIQLGQSDYGVELFLVGRDAVAIGPQSSGGRSPSTEVTVVNLADPDHPAVTRSFSLDGTAVGSRLVAGRVVVVLEGAPRLPFVSPSDAGPAASANALAANRRMVSNSSLADWLPSVSTTPTGTRRLAACGSALHPNVASGLGTVSVVSLDPSSDKPGREATVLGNASVVYASTTTMYLATESWS